MDKSEAESEEFPELCEKRGNVRKVAFRERSGDGIHTNVVCHGDVHANGNVFVTGKCEIVVLNL